MKNKELYISIFFAIIIFVLGFGMMNVFWMFSLKSERLPGLYAYKAATIGDGLCFPILVGTLLYVVKKDNVLNRWQNIGTYIFGIIMAIIGILMQISWLRDDNIALNWTIPKPHYFNAAGWYHAFFFVLMFGLLGLLFSKMYLIRVILSPTGNNSEKISVFLIWFSGSFFLLLHFLDDYKDTYNSVWLLSICALIIFTLAIFLNGITAKKLKPEEVICVFSGILSALGLSIVIGYGINRLSIVAVAGFFLAFAYVFQCGNDLLTVIVNSILITVPTLSMNLALVSIEKEKEMAFIFGLAVVSPFIIAQIQKKNISKEVCTEINKYILDGCILTILISCTIVFLEINMDNMEIITGLVSLAVNIIVSIYVKYSIEKNFEYLKNREDERKSLVNTSEQNKMLVECKKSTYLLIVMVGLGALLYLLLMLSSYIELKPFWNKTDFVLGQQEIILLILFGTAIFVISHYSNISQREVKKVKVILAYFLIFTAYTLLALNIYCLRMPFIFDKNFTSCFSIFMILGSSFMVAESFYSNLIGIRAIDRNNQVIIATGLIFVGNIFSITVALLPAASLQGDRSSDLILVFISILGCFAATLLLPFLIGRIVYCEIPDIQIATASPLGGIIQNGFLIGILVILGGIVPIYFTSISKSNMYLFCGIISIICNIYWILCFCMQNNVEHLKKRVKEYENYARFVNDDMAYLQVSGLAKHLKRQNIASFVSLLFYVSVPLFIEMAGECSRNGTVENMMKKYIPSTKINR